MYEGNMNRLIMTFILISISANASLLQKLDLEVRLSKSFKTNKDFVGKDGEVKGVPSSWVNILEINSIGSQKWCLNYRIPFKHKLGILRLSNAKKCLNSVMEKTPFEIDKVKSIKVSAIKELVRLKLNDKRYQFFRMTIGKLVSFNDRKVRTKNVIGPKFLNDSKDILICHDFDKNCNERVSNKCNQCQYGYFSGAASECAGKAAKYCGISRCGERNMPACPRGNVHTDIVALTGCQNGSLSGFCQGGLIIVCENGQLYCR
jgi:hypothetical protein